MRRYISQILKYLGLKKKSFFTNEYPEFKNDEIGKYTYGRPRILFRNNTSKLKIGKYCSISENVKIFLGGNHRIDWVSTYPFSVIEKLKHVAGKIKGHPATKGSVIIENDVWIGHSVVLLSGITIENGAVIGANSVVTKSVGPYEIWAGNPAKLIKKRFSDDSIEKLLKYKWWDKNTNEIEEIVPLLCHNNIEKLFNHAK